MFIKVDSLKKISSIISKVDVVTVITSISEDETFIHHRYVMIYGRLKLQTWAPPSKPGHDPYVILTACWLRDCWPLDDRLDFEYDIWPLDFEISNYKQ